MIEVAWDADGKAALAQNLPIIELLARVDGVTLGTAPKGALTIAVAGGTFAIPLAGVIDVAAEKARLSKALEKSDKDIAGLNARLNNPKFVANATPEVVEETREAAALKQAEIDKLKTALSRLADMG
jgi:valyl-tRNA synthetase